jgi:predicted DNA-binding protein
MREKTINICIRFPPELHERMKKVKEETGVPIHFQVIKALEEKFGIKHLEKQLVKALEEKYGMNQSEAV